MTTPEQLANQIRAQLSDVSHKIAELSNMGFSVTVMRSGESFLFDATKQVEIKL